jgi:tetratricopeptide (TPR) repeat protein
LKLLLAFSLLLQSAPRTAQDWKSAGVLAAQQGDYETAAQAFEESCRLDPRLPDACYYLGRALYYLNRFEDALTPLRKSLGAGGDAARAHTAIAQALEALGRAEEAEQSFRAALRSGKAPETRVRYAVFLFRQGRTVEALHPLQEVLKADPAHFEANLESGRVLLQLGRLEDAVKHLERALESRPDSSQAHLLAARALQRSGRTAEAEKHLKAVKAPEP